MKKRKESGRRGKRDKAIKGSSRGGYGKSQERMGSERFSTIWCLKGNRRKGDDLSNFVMF